MGPWLLVPTWLLTCVATWTGLKAGGPGAAVGVRKGLGELGHRRAQEACSDLRK